MTLPMVEITELFEDQGGPLAGVLVVAELSEAGISANNKGLYGQRVFRQRTDANGLLTLNVWPNSEGLSNTFYRFNAWHPVSGQKIINNVEARVPNYAGTLSDILMGVNNPVSLRVQTAIDQPTKNNYDTAIFVVQPLPDSYTKRIYLARLAVLNLMLWPFVDMKKSAAEAAVGLLNVGSTRTDLENQIENFLPFVDAYELAAKAAIERDQLGKVNAQMMLNTAPYGEAWNGARDLVQSLIDSVYVSARFNPIPTVKNADDLTALVAGAHPVMSVDGLSVRNPGGDSFGFLSDTAIRAGDGWAVVEFDVPDNGVVGLATLSAFNSLVSAGDSTGVGVFLTKVGE